MQFEINENGQDGGMMKIKNKKMNDIKRPFGDVRFCAYCFNYFPTYAVKKVRHEQGGYVSICKECDGKYSRDHYIMKDNHKEENGS